MPGSLLQQSLAASEGYHLLPQPPKCFNLGRHMREMPSFDSTWRTSGEYFGTPAPKSSFLDVDANVRDASHAARLFLPEVSPSSSLPSSASRAGAASLRGPSRAAVTSFAKTPTIEERLTDVESQLDTALDGRVTLVIDVVLFGLIAVAILRGEALKQRLDASSSSSNEEAHHRRQPAPAPVAAAPAPAPGPPPVLHADADAS